MLNFWAAWCEPCRRELPAFERLAAALKGKPVIVLLVNIGDPRTVIDKVIDRNVDIINNDQYHGRHAVEVIDRNVSIDNNTRKLNCPSF